MFNNEFAEALSSFTGKPTANSAFKLICSCRDFICRQARCWRQPALSVDEKMREIMSEMLLILLEDFDPNRSCHPNSMFAYLHAKIMRLTKPCNKRNMIFLDDCGKIESGRYCFSSGRLQLAEEIFIILRDCLLGCANPNTAQLEFLFIHIYPEVRWISRLLARQNGKDEASQIEADKKRHQSFNRSLRSALRNLQNGDFSEVMSWSSGERSHLAWRLIDIAPVEISEELEGERQILAEWRENIDRRQPQSLQNLAATDKIHECMKSRHQKSKQSCSVAEEAAVYGEEPDILLQLIGQPAENVAVADKIIEWDESANIRHDPTVDQLFEQVAGEVSNWFNTLVINKNSAEIKDKTSYNSGTIKTHRH